MWLSTSSPESPSICSLSFALNVKVFFETVPSEIAVLSPLRVSVPVKAVPSTVRSRTMTDPLRVSPCHLPVSVA
jgi:hypothetical protein